MTPAPATPTPPATSKRQSNMTHVYLRNTYLAHYPDTCFALGEWRRYGDGIWPAVSEWQIKKELQSLIEHTASSWRIHLTNALLNSVLELIKIEAWMESKKFDADPDLIVFKNAALRISTKIQEQHSPIHYATTRLEFDYDPDALCPTWMNLLDHLNPEVLPFLQEFAGYSLTTQTKYEVAIWLHGITGGGKSTFLMGLTTMLGTRAGVLDLPNLERSTFALTNLIGKTLVISTEQPMVYMGSTSIINRIISGEEVTIDIKHKDPIVIKPKAKVAWAMNEMPRIKEAGSGLFRRVKVIEFPEIPQLERDPEVKEVKIPAEAQGIFNWSLAGLERLNQRGHFEVPSVVAQSTCDFQSTNDIPAMFLADDYIRDPNEEIYSSALYQNYKQWCFDNGHKAASSTSIAQDWKRLGLIQRRDSKGVIWKGIKPKPLGGTP